MAVRAQRAVIWGVILAGVVLFSWGSLAAQPAERAEPVGELERAEQHYRMAVQFYGQGRYRESVEEFDLAIGLQEDPVMHCNRAAPLIKLGELREARESLRRCRDGYAPGDSERAYVDAEVAALGLVLDRILPRSKEVVRGLIEGPPTVEGSAEVEFLAPADPGPRRRLSGRGVAGISLVGVGALGAAGAVVLDILSASMVEEFRRQSEGGPGTSAARHEELRLQIEQRQGLFWGLTLGSVAAVSLGAGLMIWDLARGDDEVRQGVSLRGSGGQVEVQLHLRF